MHPDTYRHLSHLLLGGEANDRGTPRLTLPVLLSFSSRVITLTRAVACSRTDLDESQTALDLTGPFSQSGNRALMGVKIKKGIIGKRATPI